MEVLISIGRGLLGMAVMFGILFLMSSHRKSINWRTVGLGTALQLILAFLVLDIHWVRDIFDWVASGFVRVTEFSAAGATFIFGNLVSDVNSYGFIFAFQVLPTIIFFSALSSLLYYLGILQVVIKGFAYLMVRTLKLTGAESMAAAANIFMGQTESPLVVKPYLERMSRSEIMSLMVGGFATIAGSVFAAYIGFLGGTDAATKQLFATHLLTASIMSAPAAIVAAKMLEPEVFERSIEDQQLNIPKEKIGNNLLDAIAIGTTDGVRLAVNVGAMLLVFTALVTMANYMLSHWVGSWTGLNEFVKATTNERLSEFNLEYILGILFAPVAWLLGVDGQDTILVGQLLGFKTAINEFYAYASLDTMKETLSEKSLIIATYALCGFANFASIGIQIGGISAIAPSQRKNLTELGFRAMIGGTIAAFMTAIIVGMMV